MNILALHRCDTTNIGDIVSSPCLYFEYGADYHDAKQEPPVADVYICGGGAITTMVARHHLPGLKIAWGIGQSIRGGCRATRNLLKDFALVGSRDLGVHGTTWVPCASCMSPLFDQEYEVEHEVVYYLNSRKPPKLDQPVATNRSSFEEAVSFLGSAATVRTDSYHGMYWANLLGKKVEVTRPYSSKFYQMKTASLAECRDANIKFNDKVQELISNG